MDIQVASNFERLIFDITSCNSDRTLKLMKDLDEKGYFQIEQKELEKINENFSSDSLTEKETQSVIKETYKNYGILVDPHTAIGIGVAKKILPKGNTVILATAHPSKFSKTVMESTGIKPELPENLKTILVKEEKYDKLPKSLKTIQKYILERS